MERNLTLTTAWAPVAPRALETEKRTSIWQELVEGRLVIVSTESVGARREFLARASAAEERLTLRELRIVRAVARGLANKQIAYELGLSTSGVGRGIDGALRKLGLERRVDLAVLGAAFDPRAPEGAPRPAASVEEVRRGTQTFLLLTAALDEHPRWQILSAAERAVVELVIAGHENASIARVRGTSSRTIANQLARVFRKLGVSGRTALASHLVIGPWAEPAMNSWAA